MNRYWSLIDIILIHKYLSTVSFLEKKKEDCKKQIFL